MNCIVVPLFCCQRKASCLLAGLATMDWETVYSLITLRCIERDINKGLQIKPVSMSSSKVLEPSSESYEQCRKQQAALSSDEKKMSLRDLIFRIALCRPRTELFQLPNNSGVLLLSMLRTSSGASIWVFEMYSPQVV